VTVVDSTTGEIVVRSLDQCEAVIQRGVGTFIEVGEALMEIRDRRLYQLEFASFDSYCRERWGFNRQRAHQLITASEVSSMLDSDPVNARQAEALAPLKDRPEEMKEVMDAVIAEAAAAGGTVTAERISEKVSERIEAQQPRQRTLVERQNILSRYDDIKSDPAKCEEMAQIEGFLTVNALRKFCSATRKLLAEGDQRTKLSEAERVEQIVAAAAEGLHSRQIASRLGIGLQHVRNLIRRNAIDVPADQVIGRSRHLDSARIVSETASTLEGVANSLRLVDFDELDVAETEDWATSISDSLRALTRFNKRLKEMTQ
jgi:transposase